MAPKYWYKRTDNATYLVSTDTNLADLDFITAAFASEDMGWAKPLSPESTKAMLANSCTLCLYAITTSSSKNNVDSHSTSALNSTPQSSTTDGQSDSQSLRREDLLQIGMARIITDYVTFAWLTDVYLHRDYRGKGLGEWLMSCTKEILDGRPDLRRTMLLTDTPKRGVPFYEKTLGAKLFVQNMERLVVMTTGRNG